jgi:precorrin-6B methylase 2
MLGFIVLVLLIVGYYGFYKWSDYTTNAGAPFVPLEPHIIENIMQIAEVKESDIFYDLGSGDGRVTIAAALRGAYAVGIEMDPLRVFYSKIWVRLFRLENKVTIKKGDMFKTNISDATIVCTYLLPGTHQKLKLKLEKELKKGTKIIAVAFEYEDWKVKKVNVHGPIYGPIMLYEL